MYISYLYIERIMLSSSCTYRFLLLLLLLLYVYLYASHLTRMIFLKSRLTYLDVVYFSASAFFCTCAYISIK